MAACSRSASSNTRKGQFPPNSRVTFFNPSAQILATSLPMRVLPVKVTFLTSSCRHKASDSGGVLSRLVGKTLNTPGGKPACRARYPNVNTEKGVSGDGLTIMVQPAARAAPALRRIMAIGKFHGVNATATPMGCLMVKIRRPGAAGVETVPWILSASPANHLCIVSHSQTHVFGMLSADLPGKSQSIVEFSLALSNRFTSLVSHNLRNVISVLSNECIPFQKPLSSGPWVDLAIGLKGRVSCLDSLVYIIGSVVRSRGPSFSSSRIFIEMVSGLSLDGITKANIPTTSKRLLDWASTHSPLTRELSRHISLLFNWLTVISQMYVSNRVVCLQSYLER